MQDERPLNWMDTSWRNACLSVWLLLSRGSMGRLWRQETHSFLSGYCYGTPTLMHWIQQPCNFAKGKLLAFTLSCHKSHQRSKSLAITDAINPVRNNGWRRVFSPQFCKLNRIDLLVYVDLAYQTMVWPVQVIMHMHYTCFPNSKCHAKVRQTAADIMAELNCFIWG